MDKFQDFMFYVLTGTQLIAIMLFLPDKHLVKMAHWPLLSPNWVSLWRLPITWAGFALYWSSYKYAPFAGFLVIAFGLGLDRLDGKMAALTDKTFVPLEQPLERYSRAWWLEWWKELNFPGKTPLGEWLDPLIDKLIQPPMLVLLALQGLVNLRLALVVLVVEILSTFMRPPMQLMPAQYVQATAASWSGKIKFLLQTVTMIFCMIVHRAWFETDRDLPNYTLGASLGFAVLSIGSRVQYSGPLAFLNGWFRFLKRLNKYFAHKKSP